MTTERPQLLVPALRGTIGRWVYYAALLSMEEIADRVSFAREVNKDEGLNNEIQRALRKKAKVEIRDYLLQQDERFFNALVIGVYGGHPEWYSVAIRKSSYLKLTELPESATGVLGVLVLRGDEQLFALDGQHRVAGIKEAVKQRSKLGSEQVSALFVAHERSEAGRQRTRRLFTTLNRYAKPVSTTDAIVQDEDDVVAIITRDLVNDYPLFAGGRTLVSQARAIPAADKEHFTQIVALYYGMDAILQSAERVDRRAWRRFKKFRPPDAEVARLRRIAIAFWDELRRRVRAVNEMATAPLPRRVAAKYRTSQGGNLLFRPAGIDVITRAAALLLDRGTTLRRAVAAVSRVPMELPRKPWPGLLWNLEARRMLTQKDHRSVAIRLVAYLAGLSLTRRQKEKLRVDWAKVLQTEPSEIRLPRRSR